MERYILKLTIIGLLISFLSISNCYPQSLPGGGYQGGIYGGGGDEKAQNHGFMLDINVYLEGAFDVSNLNTHLNDVGLLPLNQPYDNPPWSYPGTESVGAIPNADIVDWLLVELRDASDAVSAIPSTIVEKQAVFLKKDGSIVGLNGTSMPIFNETINQKLFVVIRHRNHLGIMSANALTSVGGPIAGLYEYDFTTAMGMAYMNGQKGLNGTVYGMYASDADANGKIELNDKSVDWSGNAGEQGYLNTDFNMDGQADNPDKNETWLNNLTKESQVPE